MAPIVIKDTDALAAILEGEDALSAAETLVNEAEETYFNLGGVLAHIYYEGLYKGAGFDSAQGFADYTKARLNIDYRKARATGCTEDGRIGAERLGLGLRAAA